MIAIKGDNGWMNRPTSAASPEATPRAAAVGVNHTAQDFEYLWPAVDLI
ncbi:MAG: hypothetical protein LBK59_00550 [Bifidobacteriaceae bacterium]|nr:hypothetical protein [Bifidobacteriaceae bacterium]